MNIIRFNWHQYVIVLIAILILFITAFFLLQPYQSIIFIIGTLALSTTLISLFVSYYVYDYSDFYCLDFVKNLNGLKLLNINAGFDETSEILKTKYPQVILTMSDFYNPEKHTELSIKRARKAYPASKETILVNTSSLPFKDQEFDIVICVFSAHEIRDINERINFLKELSRILNPVSGEAYLIEHLRDFPNFLAYNIGFFHFYSKKTWNFCFKKSGLALLQENKITPFVSTFILKSDGVSN